MAAHKLMVLVDGSAHGDAAFRKALDFKREQDTLLIVNSCQFPDQMVYSTTPFAAESEIEPEVLIQHKKLVMEQANRLLQHYKAICDEQKVDKVEVKALESATHPKDAVCTFAEEQHVTTVFVGTRGLGALKKMFLGSFSDYIVQHMHCDVVVVKS